MMSSFPENSIDAPMHLLSELPPLNSVHSVLPSCVQLKTKASASPVTFGRLVGFLRPEVTLPPVLEPEVEFVLEPEVEYVLEQKVRIRDKVRWVPWDFFYLICTPRGKRTVP